MCSEHSLIAASRRLAERLEGLSFRPPVAYVYNPTIYARDIYERYVRRYGGSPKRAVFVGMNPGPWGMVQTGVPFGDVVTVRTWMELCGEVGTPKRQHHKRQVSGFECRRREVSGRRLWSLFSERFGSPEEFFRMYYVTNYCPAAFFDDAGRNLTPDKIHRTDRPELFDHCDEHLKAVIAYLRPRWVIGIGKFAETRAGHVVGLLQPPKPAVTGIVHPSPANPSANRGWGETVTRQLRATDVWK